MVSIPNELASFFLPVHFKSYPKLTIPQSFNDSRGYIINIADGQLGDVAFIKSLKGAVRANHVHQTDWHITYCISGALKYVYENEEKNTFTVDITEGELFYTPVNVPHRMEFLEETLLIVVSRNSRKSELYNEDTSKIVLQVDSNIVS